MTDNHGHAAWAPEDEIRKRFSGPGCLIGMVNGKLFFDDPNRGPGHSMVIAGSGSDKTVTAITRLFHYTLGPRIVFDPSSQIGPIMMDALEAEGYRVISIHSPTFNRKTKKVTPAHGFNALSWIDIRDPEADAHILSVVDWIYDEAAADQAQAGGGRDPFWGKAGRNVVACLLADILYAPIPDEEKTLTALRETLVQPEEDMEMIFASVHKSSKSSMARDLASGLLRGKAKQTFSSIRLDYFTATAWLSVGGYADVVSGNSMQTADVLDSKTVVFVQIPIRTLLSSPGLGKATMGALFNEVLHADGDIKGRILMLLDEAYLLGPMKEILLFHKAARKYKCAIQTLWTSEADLDYTWGKDVAKILRDTSSWRSYSAIQDGDIAEKLSRDIGHHAVMAHSEGENQGAQKPWLSPIPGSRSMGRNTNTHEIKRRLITADEILRSSANRMIVMARDFAWPIDAVSAPYFEQEDIRYRVNADRFVTATE